MLKQPYFIHTAVASPVTHALTPLFDVGEFQHKVIAINLCVGKIPEMELLHALCCMFYTLACYLLMKLKAFGRKRGGKGFFTFLGGVFLHF